MFVKYIFVILHNNYITLACHVSYNQTLKTVHSSYTKRDYTLITNLMH